MLRKLALRRVGKQVVVLCRPYRIYNKECLNGVNRQPSKKGFLIRRHYQCSFHNETDKTILIIDAILFIFFEPTIVISRYMTCALFKTIKNCFLFFNKTWLWKNLSFEEKKNFPFFFSLNLSLKKIEVYRKKSTLSLQKKFFNLSKTAFTKEKIENKTTNLK